MTQVNSDVENKDIPAFITNSIGRFNHHRVKWFFYGVDGYSVDRVLIQTHLTTTNILFILEKYAFDP